jgi:hypothetical protein
MADNTWINWSPASARSLQFESFALIDASKSDEEIIIDNGGEVSLSVQGRLLAQGKLNKGDKK